MAQSRLPVFSTEGGLSHYLTEIRKFPMLEPQEEYMLAKSWREHGDREAAHRAEVEGIATDDHAAVTCRKCRDLLYKLRRDQKE